MKMMRMTRMMRTMKITRITKMINPRTSFEASIEFGTTDVFASWYKYPMWLWQRLLECGALNKRGEYGTDAVSKRCGVGRDIYVCGREHVCIFNTNLSPYYLDGHVNCFEQSIDLAYIVWPWQFDSIQQQHWQSLDRFTHPIMTKFVVWSTERQGPMDL